MAPELRNKQKSRWAKVVAMAARAAAGGATAAVKAAAT